MSESEVRQLIAGYDGVVLDNRSTPELAIYSIKGQVMAVVHPESQPVSIGLRCDPNLGELLRRRYESVSLESGLNKKRFINILLVGQLSDEEVRSQIRHAYEETNRLLTAGS